MPTAGVKVLFVSKSWDVPYDVCVCDDPRHILTQVARFQPDVVVTSEFIPGNLNVADFGLRKRWLHLDPNTPVETVISTIESCYASTLWGSHRLAAKNPLVTIYTGTYNTGDCLRDTYQSLRDQTYTNWEWVVVDDGSTDDTWNKLLSYAEDDHRVRPFQMKHNGKIGNTKDVATRLATGVYLIELDHDDMLVDTAVDEVKKAFDENPDVGMVYTNCACFYPDGRPQQYNDEFWKDRYRDTEYRGKVYKECINPDIYGRFGPYHQQQFGWFLTVGPNHIRAYRAETLKELGGYNRNLPIADDWDVYARFFLHSKCLHVNKMLYLYRFHDGWKNTTFTRNKSIQDHLELGRKHYEQEFINFNTKRMSEEKLLSVIIVDWNTPALTQRCVQSVRKCCPESEIILVQNGDKFDCSEVDKIVPLEMNLGFAAGCNAGALHASTNFLCFLNSDTVVEEDVLHRLVANASDPHVGVAAPYSNKARPPQGYFENGQTPGTQEVDSVVGFCMVMRQDLFEELGGFDTTLCNFEDDDICRRIRERGLLCRIVENTWVYHEEHASFEANGVDAQAEIRKSEAIFNKKYPKVKVIAITLDEMDCLPGFFDQFKHITTDFAILDSGSKDGTVEWAKKAGVKVAHRKFDDFASQRNAAAKLLGGDAEWIIMADPDERLDENTLKNFQHLLTQDKYDIFLAPLWAVHPDGSERQWVSKPFLYKNTEKIHWIFSVHEKLIGSYSQALIRNSKLSHMLEYHTPERRKEMEVFYASLSKDEGHLAEDYPILDYEHPDHEGIAKVTLGELISVVVPTYNRPELLKRAVNSLLEQDYLPLEVVIVGDACPDLYCAFSDSRVRTYNLPSNHGAGGAVPRNYGIMLSSGSLVAYLDDDNLLKRNHLSSIFGIISADSSEYGLSSMEVDGKPLICEKPEFGSVDTSCLVHRKYLVRKFGWWKNREEGGYAHDWEFVSRWVDGGVQWAVTREPTVIYNKETSGQSAFLSARVG